MSMKTLPRIRMGEIGLPAASARAFLRRASECGLHSFLFVRGGKVGAEGYWTPYAPAYPHMLHSLSKSFTSTAFGFAVQEGLLSLDDPVTKFFPEKLPSEPCENMRKMRIRHLLTMNTGHTVEPGVIDDGGSVDWVEKFLHSYVSNEPGTGYLYSTAATYMVSAIIQKVTGQTVCDFLRPRLFDPLGFGEFWWDTCPKGISTGGFGLNLQTEDIAKFGVFLANRGEFDGRQLLDPAWVDAATSWQVPTAKENTPDWAVGYGYQFWMCNHPGTFRGDGAFGQLCVVCRPKNTVFACTGQIRDFQEIMDALYEYLIDPLSDEILPETAEEAAFASEAAALTFPLPQGERTTPAAASVSGKTYEIAPNRFGIKTLSFRFGEETTLTLETADGVSTLPVGFGEFLDGETAVPPRANVHSPFYHEVSCAGAWKDGQFHLTAVYTRTSTNDRMTFAFLPHGIRMTIDRAGSFFGGVTELSGFLTDGGRA